MTYPKPDGWHGGDDGEMVDTFHGHRSDNENPIIDHERQQHSRTVDEFGDA